MREIVLTTQFRRDAKRMQKRGLDLSEMRAVAKQIAAGETLQPRHRDHKLAGPFAGFRECHIRPDWLLIYRTTEADLFLVRTGTHQDLFDE